MALAPENVSSCQNKQSISMMFFNCKFSSDLVHCFHETCNFRLLALANHFLLPRSIEEDWFMEGVCEVQDRGQKRQT
eukprot:6463128-Amphidinium_carterae.3